MIYGQLGENHPLVQMIVQCLGFPEDRPSIHEVLRWLEEGREEVRDEQTDMNKLELLQALQTQQGNQVRECDRSCRCSPAFSYVIMRTLLKSKLCLRESFLE